MNVARVSSASMTGMTWVVMASTAATVPPGFLKITCELTALEAPTRRPAASRNEESEATEAGVTVCEYAPICVTIAVPELP